MSVSFQINLVHETTNRCSIWYFGGVKHLSCGYAHVPINCLFCDKIHSWVHNEWHRHAHLLEIENFADLINFANANFQVVKINIVKKSSEAAKKKNFKTKIKQPVFVQFPLVNSVELAPHTKLLTALKKIIDVGGVETKTKLDSWINWLVNKKYSST